MKILVVSNFYPPYKIGGYELLCEDVIKALYNRGHEITVLTSTYGVKKPTVEGFIYRQLSLESNLHYYERFKSWFYPVHREKNVNIIRHLIQADKPDIIFIWGMWGMTKLVAQEAEKLCVSRVVYYLANPWPIEPSLHKAYWELPASGTGRSIIKKIISIPFKSRLKEEWDCKKLNFRYAPCCSEALRNQLLAQDVPLKDAPVIYEGINLSPYKTVAENRKPDQKKDKLELLFVGILAPHKGVHTTIEALKYLSTDVLSKTHLTLLGTGQPDYEARLRKMVEEYSLSNEISFHAPIPRDQLPGFLAQHDILLLPSIWDEPLALVMQEGLASGMVVVGSATGGTKEIILHGKNGLLFQPNDPSELAQAIQLLVEDPGLRSTLSKNGFKTAVEKFDLNRMVENLETYLMNVLKLNPNAPFISN